MRLWIEAFQLLEIALIGTLRYSVYEFKTVQRDYGFLQPTALFLSGWKGLSPAAPQWVVNGARGLASCGMELCVLKKCWSWCSTGLLSPVGPQVSEASPACSLFTDTRLFPPFLCKTLAQGQEEVAGPLGSCAPSSQNTEPSSCFHVAGLVQHGSSVKCQRLLSKSRCRFQCVSNRIDKHGSGLILAQAMKENINLLTVLRIQNGAIVLGSKMGMPRGSMCEIYPD